MNKRDLTFIVLISSLLAFLCFSSLKAHAAWTVSYTNTAHNHRIFSGTSSAATVVTNESMERIMGATQTVDDRDFVYFPGAGVCSVYLEVEAATTVVPATAEIKLLPWFSTFSQDCQAHAAPDESQRMTWINLAGIADYPTDVTSTNGYTMRFYDTINIHEQGVFMAIEAATGVQDMTMTIHLSGSKQ